MSSLKAEVGSRLAQIRKEHGDTQEVTARKLGIKRPNLSAYEKGINAMPDDIRDKFVRMYNTSHDYLISGKSEMVVREPAAEYAKRDVISLLDQLEDSELTRELRLRVLRLSQQNTELKDKVIQLLEEQQRRS